MLAARISAIVAGLLGVAGIGFLDRLTGPEISFSVFYLLPVSYVSWKAGLPAGILLSASSAATWLLADFASQAVYSHELIPYWNMLVRGMLFLIVSVLLSKLREAYEKVKRVSRQDYLTGVENLRSFQAQLKTETLRADRYGHPASLAYIDLDDFKSVNDSLGHRTGDELLRTVAQTIRSNIRGFDSIARLGGDEFAVLMPETGSQDALRMTERFRSRLDEAMAAHGWPVTFSIGLVTCRTPPESAEEWVQIADEMMYCAKKKGKNTLMHRSM